MRADKRIAKKASREIDRAMSRGMSPDEAKTLSNSVGATILLTGSVALLGAPPALAGAIGGAAGTKVFGYLSKKKRRKRRRAKRAKAAARRAQRREEQMNRMDQHLSEKEAAELMAVLKGKGNV